MYILLILFFRFHLGMLSSYSSYNRDYFTGAVYAKKFLSTYYVAFFIFHLHAYISYTCNVWLWLYMGTTLSLVYHGYTSYYHYYFFTTSTFYKFNVCIWLISLKVPGYASLRRNLLHLAPRYSLHELLLLFLSILHELDFFLNSIGIQIMSCLSSSFYYTSLSFLSD